jgi:hypothetical protein
MAKSLPIWMVANEDGDLAALSVFILEVWSSYNGGTLLKE